MKRIFLPQFLFSNGCYEDVQKVEKAKNERKKKGGENFYQFKLKWRKREIEKTTSMCSPFSPFPCQTTPKKILVRKICPLEFLVTIPHLDLIILTIQKNGALSVWGCGIDGYIVFFLEINIGRKDCGPWVIICSY